MKTHSCLIALLVAHVRALWTDPQGWRAFRAGTDLQHFVTRPEIKAPRYMVAKHHPEAISPGYWLVTPYTRISKVPSTEAKDYTPCVNGAHIYDGDGNLVWSGACMYDNRLVFNFRPVRINGTDLFTFYLPGEEHGFMIPMDERLPSGVLMNHRYEEVSRTQATEGYLMDGHEFNIMPDGRSSLLTTLQGVDADASTIGESGTRAIMDTGFQEVEMNTGTLLFDWDPLQHGVSLNESCDEIGMGDKREQRRAWDFFHINSVDKFANGDYLASARHTSTLYRISKDDGHIIWRLGGCYDQSDFVMEDNLPFFWQHHARVRFENETHSIISLFDNASDDRDRGPPRGQNPPVGKIIVLDHASTPQTAKMLRRFDRPDAGQTAALGSLSLLGDRPVEEANVFIDWAFEGYISEYDYKDGVNRLIFEAKFVSDRKRSYRAYKFPFKADPVEPPILAVLPIGFGQDDVASAFYVSWNGATEVASWNFYGGESNDERVMTLLATIKKRGFETEWVMPGVVQYAYAEAVDAEGVTLRKTNVTSITPSVDPNYRIPYPALDVAKAAGGTPQLLPSTSDDWVSHDTDGDGPSQPGHGSVASLTDKMLTKSNLQNLQNLAAGGINRGPWLVIDVLAILGLFFAARTLSSRLFRRQKWYSSLPAFLVYDVESR